MKQAVSARLDEPVKRPRRLADRCPFTFRGHPCTAPGTPDDAKRIYLSQWITALLVRDGHEKPGAYLTPGANGYTPEELAAAPARYAHLLAPAPAVPEKEQQAQALVLLQNGISKQDILAELEITAGTLAGWRQAEPFATEWEEAKAQGSGKRVRSSARHDALAAERVAPAPPAPEPEPSPTTAMPAPATFSPLQQTALEKLRAGQPSAQVLRETQGLNGNKLALWRRDPAFAAEWDATRSAQRPTKPAVGSAPARKWARATEPEPEIQVKVLALVTSGVNFRQILAERTVPGFHMNALNRWRRDSDFQQRWSVALAAGREVRGTSNLVKPKAAPGPTQALDAPPVVVTEPAVFDQLRLLFGAEQLAAYCRLSIYLHRTQTGGAELAAPYEAQLRQLAA